MLMSAFILKAQDTEKESVNADKIEQLRETLNDHSDRFKGLDERLSEMSSDLDKLKSLSISGYIQAQYESYDYWNASGSTHGVVPTSGAPVITNSFFLRRARVKFAYKAANGVEFVLCPNFDVDRIQIKDAYVQLHDRWTDIFTLTMGQF